MPIKLLAIDLDGTIVADLHTIPARTQATIRAAIDKGVRITIATGREQGITVKFANLLGLTTPIICCHGALIYDHQTDETIASEYLHLPLVHQLIDLSRSHNLALYLYLDDKAYAEHTTTQSRAMFGTTGTPVVQVNDLKQVVTTSPIKALIVHPLNEIEAMTGRLQAALGNSVRIFRSGDTLIEITSPNASKGRALATLAAYYGILQAEVMAIGDQDSDIEMIAWAGLGIAVGNASPGAKAAADYVAPPLSQEGAAWAIEHFILQS